MEFLKKIFSHSQPAKPLAALTWVKDLTGMDDISAIEFATQQLSADSKNNAFQDDEHLEALLLIDGKIHEIVEKITAHYLNIDNMGIELEERIANAIFLYHRQIFLIYYTLIENLAQFQPTSLLVMLARAMCNATQMIKWRYYNYQSAPANVWLQISHIYIIGEKQSLLDDYVIAYKDQEATALSSTYIRACMLGNLESLSFHRKQIDLVCKMLATWTPKILINKEYDEKMHLFYVDTASDAPAKRIRNFKPANSYRYWCFDSINTKVELCLSLIEFNISPKQQIMQEFITNKFAQATLEILRTEWSRVEYKRQRRGAERTKTTKFATTSYGFEDTCYHIKQHESILLQRGEKYYQGNKSFDERLAAHHVVKDIHEPNIIFVDLGAGQSTIVDESIQGIGLYISKPAHEVSIGMMIGVSIKDQKDDTIIGIIRSIKPIVGNELHIGVEILSRSAVCVETKNMSYIASKISYSSGANGSSLSNSVSLTRKDLTNNISLYNDITNFNCLYLPQEFALSKQETLIVPKLYYNKNDAYKVNISGVEMLVKFTETFEQHENWLRVSFVHAVENQLAA